MGSVEMAVQTRKEGVVLRRSKATAVDEMERWRGQAAAY
jgi:hypothetical protein